MTTAAVQEWVEAWGADHPEHGDAALDAVDGFACGYCGERGGEMVPCGRGPRGQVFAHPGCEGTNHG